jgi:hypothetical protein
MRRPGLLFACVVLLGACRRSTPTGASDAAPVPSTSAVAQRTTGDVVYDCSSIEPSPVGSCDAGASPVFDLIALSDKLTEVAAEHERPKPAYWAHAEAIVTSAERVSVASLSPRERIAAQNAALHLSFVAAPEVRARDLVARLAFPRASRPESVEPDRAIERWLGPREQWTERTTAMRPLMHESIFFTTRVLRLVRTKTLRANFAQLVAIDDAGNPYITSVVGSIELRRGFDGDARACVVLLGASRVRCDQEIGGLEAVVSPSALPQSHFLAHDDSGHVRCNNCHAPETPDVDFGMAIKDVTADERTATLDERRNVVLRKLGTALSAW